MRGIRGRILREDEVVHLVAQQLTDLSSALASVGERDDAFPVTHGRGDQVRYGAMVRIRVSYRRGACGRGISTTIYAEIGIRGLIPSLTLCR